MKIRNLFLGLTIMILAFGILSISVWSVLATQTLSEMVTVKITPTPSSAPVVDYHLPYPGILPDNKIFYPIKMIRDRILLFLTFDSVRKAERLLFFADKRLNAAKALIEGGKVDLGISTMTKAEKYLEQAINQAEKGKREGKETTVLYKKLTKAILKHEEVMTEFLTRVPDEAKRTIQEAIRHLRQNYEKVTVETEKGK